MPLTPEDVSNKRFTPVRLREGYDMGEVDQFLDEVEAELSRLIKENEDLREQLKSASSGSSSSNDTASATPAVPTPKPEPAKEPEPAAVEPQQSAAPLAQTGPQEIKVTTTAEASQAAARLLEIATNNADQLVTEAHTEADRILGEARVKAERQESESKTRADRLESDARTRAQMLDSETAERRNQLFGDMEKEKGRLNTEIEGLRSFEREYRSRLKSYFTQQLAALDNGDSSSQQPGQTQESSPKRLKSLLGEDD